MIYKLFAAAGSTVSVDVRIDDTIVAVLMSNAGTQPSELSFGSTATINTNDSTAAIATVLNGVDISVSGLNIPVNAGERIYLHNVAGAGALDAACMIYTAGKDNRAAVRRR